MFILDGYQEVSFTSYFYLLPGELSERSILKILSEIKTIAITQNFPPQFPIREEESMVNNQAGFLKIKKELIQKKYLKRYN